MSETVTEQTNFLEDLRKDAKKLENEIDTKLIAFAKIHLNSQSNDVDESEVALLSEENNYESLVDEIDSMLNQLKKLNDKMLELPISNMKIQYTVQRHGDLYKELRKEFEVKLAQNTSRREKEQLFHKTNQSNSRRLSLTFALERHNKRKIQLPSSSSYLYLKESQHLDETHNLVGEQIAIAMETRENLHMQRDTLKRMKTRFIDVTNRFPLLNSLLYRINFKRGKDSLILGSLIAILTFLFLYFLFF